MVKWYQKTSVCGSFMSILTFITLGSKLVKVSTSMLMFCVDNPTTSVRGAPPIGVESNGMLGSLNGGETGRKACNRDSYPDRPQLGCKSRWDWNAVSWRNRYWSHTGLFSARLNMTPHSEGWHHWQSERRGRRRVISTLRGHILSHNYVLMLTWCCLSWWSSVCWCLMNTGWSQ